MKKYMVIALCDTNNDFGKHMSNKIQNFASVTFVTIEVHTFLCSEDMVSAISRWENYAALFIEIGKNTAGHFELAKKLRSQHQHLDIVFMAVDDSYALKGYSIPIFRYLLKSDVDTRLSECMHSLIKKYCITYSIISLGEYGVRQDIHSDDIEYLTAFKNTSVIRFCQNHSSTLELAASLDQLETKFKAFGFIRIQQGFLVNAQHIIKLCNYKAYMRSGVTINTSRTNYHLIKSELALLRASR